MRGARAFGCVVNGQLTVGAVRHGNRRKAHQRAVASATRICGARERITSFAVRRECRAACHANIEALACAAHVAVSPPAHVSLHLVFGIEPLGAHQAFSKAQGHRCVIGPLAGLEVERASAYHVGKQGEHARRLEFQSRAERITGSEAKQCAVVAIAQLICVFAGQFRVVASWQIPELVANRLGCNVCAIQLCWP